MNTKPAILWLFFEKWLHQDKANLLKIDTLPDVGKYMKKHKAKQHSAKGYWRSYVLLLIRMCRRLHERIAINTNSKYGMGLNVKSTILEAEENVIIPGIMIPVKNITNDFKFLTLIQGENSSDGKDRIYFLIGPISLLNHSCSSTISIDSECPLSDIMYRFDEDNSLWNGLDSKFVQVYSKYLGTNIVFNGADILRKGEILISYAPNDTNKRQTFTALGFDCNCDVCMRL